MSQYTRTAISADHEFHLNEPCPSCGNSVTVRVTGCELRPDGTWKANSVDIDCDDACDGDGAQPHEFRAHGERIVHYLNSHYHFLP